MTFILQNILIDFKENLLKRTVVLEMTIISMLMENEE